MDFPAPVAPTRATRRPGAQVKINIPNGVGGLPRVADRSLPERDRHRPLRWRERAVRTADRIRRVGHRRDPVRRAPGLAELERGRGQGRDRLERGQRGEGDDGQRYPAQDPGSGGRDAEQQDAPQGQPRDRRGEAGAQAGCRGRAAGESGELGVGRPDPVQAGLDRAERVQLGGTVQQVGDRGAQFAAGGRGPPGGAPGRRGHGQRHQHPGGQQAGREHPGRGRQDQQHRGGRARPDQGGGQRRRDAADEQVLGGVHVADQPGEHVAGAEGGQARRGQPFQLAVDRHPDVGEDPEGHVVGEQPLQVAQHAAADAERADEDHRDRDGHDVRVLRGAGQQEARGRQQGHAGPAAARAGQHGEQQLAAHRPREPEQAEQRMTARGRGDRGHEVTASTTRSVEPFVASASDEATMSRADVDLVGLHARPARVTWSWLTRITVRPAVSAVRAASSRDAVVASRWAAGSSSSSSGASRRKARASASCWRWPEDSRSPRSPTSVS